VCRAPGTDILARGADNSPPKDASRPAAKKIEGLEKKRGLKVQRKQGSKKRFGTRSKTVGHTGVKEDWRQPKKWYSTGAQRWKKAQKSKGLAFWDGKGGVDHRINEKRRRSAKFGRKGKGRVSEGVVDLG